LRSGPAGLAKEAEEKSVSQFQIKEVGGSFLDAAKKHSFFYKYLKLQFLLEPNTSNYLKLWYVKKLKYLSNIPKILCY
jgi:hypothetical protein